MGGYRFDNPNYASMDGSIGSALNRAAGSVDNIAMAMMRSAKSPEERALMDAHQAYYSNAARKAGAEADSLDLANKNSGDPLGAIAQAILGGDRDTARANATDAINYANGALTGPVLPQYVNAVPQIQRRMDAVTTANLTDPKSIAQVMKNIQTEQQLADMAANRITPQDQAVLNYAAGSSANKPWDIDSGGLKLAMASGDVSDTPISTANVLRDRAQANQANAAAGNYGAEAAEHRARVGLIGAQTQNEIDGTPGRSGGRGAETESQRMKREAQNQAIDNARQFILNSGATRDDLLAKDSPNKQMLQTALMSKSGVNDDGYQAFASKFGQPADSTVADVLKRAVELNGETTLFGGKKNDQKAIEQTVRREFKGIGVEDSKRLVAQALNGGGAQRPTVAGTPVQQPAQQPVALPQQAVAQLKENVQTKFGNGQVWMLQNGRPVRVQ